MDKPFKAPDSRAKECDYLELNMKRCLNEKSVKDLVEDRKCNMEYVNFFFLECPERVKLYENKNILK